MEIFNPGHGPHSDGSAIDIFLNVNNAGESALANSLIRLLVRQKHVVRWGAIIYNRQTWDNRGGPVPYERARSMPHTDHIHIEWGPVGRRTSAFPGVESEIETIRQEVLRSEQNRPAN